MPHPPPSETFWCDAAQTAVYLINCLPAPNLQNRSFFFFFKMFSQKSSSYSTLRDFGCLCFVRFPSYEHTKLGAQSNKCVFIGYRDEHKWFLCYDPITRQVRVGCQVIFFESIYYYACHNFLQNLLHLIPSCISSSTISWTSRQIFHPYVHPKTNLFPLYPRLLLT